MGPDVEIVAEGGRRLNAAVARPVAAGKRPGVVVIHEVIGDQPEMRAVCRKFADRYVAVMPDLFSGRGPHPICVARTMIDASRGLVNADIDAARGWLVAQEQVDGERIGVIGFRMGGGFALADVGGSPPGVRAAAVNYGPVPRSSSRLGGACPVVASHGARDKMIGQGHAERLRGHLQGLGVDYDDQGV
jgi:carboxymethylenebutenolidase